MSVLHSGGPIEITHGPRLHGGDALGSCSRSALALAVAKSVFGDLERLVERPSRSRRLMRVGKAAIW